MDSSINMQTDRILIMHRGDKDVGIRTKIETITGSGIC